MNKTLTLKRSGKVGFLRSVFARERWISAFCDLILSKATFFLKISLKFCKSFGGYADSVRPSIYQGVFTFPRSKETNEVSM